MGINPELFLRRKSGHTFYNTSPLNMKTLLGDPGNISANLFNYVQGFSASVRDMFERFEFNTQVDRLGVYLLKIEISRNLRHHGTRDPNVVVLVMVADSG